MSIKSTSCKWRNYIKTKTKNTCIYNYVQYVQVLINIWLYTNKSICKRIIFTTLIKMMCLHLTLNKILFPNTSWVKIMKQWLKHTQMQIWKIEIGRINTRDFGTMVKPPRRKHLWVELQPFGTIYILDDRLEIPQKLPTHDLLSIGVYVYPTLLVD